MKRSALLGLAALLAFGTAGCNTHRITGHSPGYYAPQRRPTYALAVTVHGGLQPTAAQWMAIQAKVADDLALRGAVLVTDIALADRIIRVDFRPNPLAPETSGHLTILGVKTNPYAGIARTSTPSVYSPSFSFARSYMYNGWWGSSNFYSGDYLNYMGPWENGYTSGATSVAVIPKPVTPKPPHRTHPGGGGDFCPPDALHSRTTPGYATTDSMRSLSSGSSFTPSYTSPEPSRRWTGERSAWRSEASANRPARSFARSDSSGSRSSSRSDSSSRSSSRSSYRSDSSSSRWDNNSYSSPERSYSNYDSGYSSQSMSASSSHVTPSYTSPEPSPSSSSSDSGSLPTLNSN